MRGRLAHAALLTLAQLLAAVTSIGHAQEPPQPSPELYGKVRAFLDYFIDAGKTPEEQVALFADEVDYYEQGMVGKDHILHDVQRYVRHYPQRQYTLEEISYMSIDPDSDRLFVAYTIAYSVANRSKHLQGKASYGAVISHPSTAPKVVSIKEKINKSISVPDTLEEPDKNP